MDTGGSFPGGYFPNGYDIHAEGIMIPPIKIFDRGVERRIEPERERFLAGRRHGPPVLSWA